MELGTREAWRPKAGWQNSIIMSNYTVFERIYDSLKENIPYVAVAWLPALVAFVLVPFALYLPNQADWDWNLVHVLPFLILGVLSLILLFALALVRNPWRTRIALALFYFGIYLALSDLLAPVPLELIEDPSTVDKVGEPIHLTVIELGLALAIIVCAIKIPPRFVFRVGPVAVLVLVVVELITVLTSIPSRTTIAFGAFSNTAKVAKTTSDKGNAPKGNIYQIVFDCYRTGEFLDIVSESDIRGVLDGFTCFENNRANYGYTKFAYPSYMTGTLFDGRSHVEWLDRASKMGLVEQLHQAGYTSWFYVPHVWLAHGNANYVVIRKTKVLVSTGLTRMWMLRVVPNFLHHEVLWLGRKAITILRGYLHTSRGTKMAGRKTPKFPDLSQVSLMREFIEDEAKRPARGQYVYVHLYLPHPPLTWDPCCRFVGNGSYIDNARCAVKLMEEFISKLKELGRYDDSVIVIHSDHGWERSESERKVHPAPKIPKDVAAKITSVSKGYRQPEQLMERTWSLLLVKPPHAKGDLKISSATTLLLDIPATIIDLAGLDHLPGDGESVFSLDPGEQRDVHLFFGFRRLNDSGRMEVFGRQIHQLDVAHVSTKGKGKEWTMHPDLTVRSGEEGLLQRIISRLWREIGSDRQ